MTLATATAPSSRDLERQAVQAFRHEWAYWLAECLDPVEFTDDVALAILVENGIPACRLACDVQMLVGQAYWLAKEGGR